MSTLLVLEQLEGVRRTPKIPWEDALRKGTPEVALWNCLGAQEALRLLIQVARALRLEHVLLFSDQLSDGYVVPVSSLEHLSGFELRNEEDVFVWMGDRLAQLGANPWRDEL